MAGGGGQQASSSTTSIPDWLKEPTLEAIGAARNVVSQPYQAYPGQQLAGFTTNQQAAFNGASGVGSAGQTQMNQAYGSTGQGARVGEQFASGGRDMHIGNIGMTGATAGNVTAGQTSVGDFGSAEAAKYMSPYQQAVTDIAKRNAIKDNDVARLGRNADAVRAGAFGGSRAAGIRESEADSALGTRLSDMQTQGLQSSYENAQQQFERDRAARMNNDQFNVNNTLSADKFNVGNQFDASKFNSAQEFDKNKYNTTNQLSLMQQNNANRLAGGNMAAGAGAQYGQLAGQTQDMYGKGLDAMFKAGSVQQSQGQRGLDIDRNNFLNQRDYGRNNINWMMGLLSGSPGNASGDTTTTSPGPSALGQIAGTGIAALGAYSRAQ